MTCSPVQLDLFGHVRKVRRRAYSDALTADVNAKGVLDVDTVKGCTAGMAARPGTGCYGNCYAAKIATFRGLDFSTSVIRRVHSATQRRAIEAAVAASPYGFFRIGTMGDPCHAWEYTVGVVEWLSEFARPVIITKHWHKATNEQLARLARCGTALNTSVSALDTDAELRHRMRQIERFRDLGGNSVARVVSCNFNQDSVQGAAMARVQEQLLALRPIVDNPLRCSQAHPLVVSGIIRVSKQRDLSEGALVSLARQDTYLGHCSACPDQCGLTGTTYTENPKQLSLLEE